MKSYGRSVARSIARSKATGNSRLTAHADGRGRWESGRNVQTATMDVLLRLVRDIPESLRYLKKHAA